MPGGGTEASRDLLEALVELGGLLDQASAPGPLGTRRRPSADEQGEAGGRIAAAERAVEGRLQARSAWGMRRALGLRKDECPPAAMIRPLALVAYRQLLGGAYSLGVGAVARAAGVEDTVAALECRRGVRVLVAREVLTFTDGHGDGGLRLSPKVVRTLSGNNLDIAWDASSLKADLEKGQTGDQSRIERLQTAAIERYKREAEQGSRPAAAVGIGRREPMSAKEIFDALRREVIGIDPVVRRFSVQMAIHHQRLALAASGQRLTTPCVVLLLIGPSGCGKTHLAEAFGRLSRLPVGCVNMAEITAEGFVGLSVADIFSTLARPGVSMAEASTGLLILDEIDKKRSNAAGECCDISGAAVQYELLRLLEGSQVQIGGRRGGFDHGRGTVNTATMAFVLAGAFSGMAEASKSKGRRGGLGFAAGDVGDASSGDIREALGSYFVPEFLNRIGSIIMIPKPTAKQLVQIATSEPHGLLARQNALLAGFGLSLLLSGDALDAAVSWALDTGTFSRGIRSILLAVSEAAIFDEVRGELTVTAGDVHRAIQATAMTATS